MLRRFYFICAGVSLAAFGLLIAAAFLSIGINDSETRNISATGSFSRPNDLVWTPWGANDGEVRPFPGFHPDKPEPRIPEIRMGMASGLFFDFTVYEGRSIPGDPGSAIPATGPGWGAYYHALWPLGAMVVATIFVVLAFYTKEQPRGPRGP